MKAYNKYASLQGNLVMVGFGSVGQAVLPLLFRHFEIDPKQIRIISADANGEEIAREFGVASTYHVLTEKNYLSVLEPCLNKEDFLLNLSVDVSSLALIELCWRLEVLYLDTCIEPWPGGYTDTSISVSLRSNYALREKMLSFGREKREGPTAVLAHGANPGLVSTFVKQALINIAVDTGLVVKRPTCPEEWAGLACRLEIKAIHIAERDTQLAAQRKFVCRHRHFLPSLADDIQPFCFVVTRLSCNKRHQIVLDENQRAHVFQQLCISIRLDAFFTDRLHHAVDCGFLIINQSHQTRRFIGMEFIQALAPH